jgi:hypothetical protein
LLFISPPDGHTTQANVRNMIGASLPSMLVEVFDVLLPLGSLQIAKRSEPGTNHTVHFPLPSYPSTQCPHTATPPPCLCLAEPAEAWLSRILLQCCKVFRICLL